MELVCKVKAVKQWLQNNPTAKNCYLRKIMPCVNQLSQKIATDGSFTLKKLDISGFLQTFESLFDAFGVTDEQKDIHNNLIKKLSMMDYLILDNRKKWETSGDGIEPAIFDAGVSIIASKKILSTINTINEIVAEDEALNIGRYSKVVQKDLLDYAYVLANLYDDNLKITEIDKQGKLSHESICVANKMNQHTEKVSYSLTSLLQNS